MTTLLDHLEADIAAAFFPGDGSGFDEEVLVGADGADAIRGIFTSETVEGGERGGPVLELAMADVHRLSITHNTRVIVREEVYRVDGVQPSGEGRKKGTALVILEVLE